MKALLKISGLIDALNERVGAGVLWLVLASVLISAGNAISRKAFDLSSNAWLEIQWYLFAAVFMLAAGYTLLKNEHVRIDVFSSRLSPRGRTWIDIIGLIFFWAPGWCSCCTWALRTFFRPGIAARCPQTLAG